LELRLFELSTPQVPISSCKPEIRKGDKRSWKRFELVGEAWVGYNSSRWSWIPSILSRLLPLSFEEEYQAQCAGQQCS